MISWISKSDNPLVKRPPSATGSHKRNPSSSRMKASNDTQVKTNQEYVPSNYENPSSASVSKKLLSSSKQTLHNKLRPSSRTSMKSNLSLHGNDNHDSYHHGDDIRHGETDEDSLLNDPADTCSTGNNIMLPNDSSKLKTPELSSDMLNALADTVAKRLKATLQPFIEHKQGQRSVSDDSESGIASHLCPLCEKHMTGPKHTPMAAIPCGHTYCKTCIDDFKKCPTCHTVVRSAAVNTVIQGIIKDFKDQKDGYSVQKMEEQTRQYVDEYQSLVLRCNALNGKFSSIGNLESAVGSILNCLFFFWNSKSRRDDGCYRRFVC